MAPTVDTASPAPSEKSSPTTPVIPGTIKLSKLVNGTAENGTVSNGTMNGNGASKSSVITYDVHCVLEPKSLPQRFRAAPWKLLLWDFFFLLKNVAMLPDMFFPAHPIGLDIGFIGLVGQVVMIAASLVLTVFTIVTLVVGAPFIPLLLILAFGKTAEYLQGDLTRTSNSGVEVPPKMENEAWFW